MPHKKLNPGIESILLREAEEIREAAGNGSRILWFIEIKKEDQPDLFNELKGKVKENETYMLRGFGHCHVSGIFKELIQISFHPY